MRHRPILPSTPDKHATDKACVLLQISPQRRCWPCSTARLPTLLASG